MPRAQAKPLRTSQQIVNNGGVPFRAATSPYEMTDTRLSYGWNNTLIQAATPSDARQTQVLVDYDFHRTITSIGRRTLYSLARTMFWRIPPLQAAILEQANLTGFPFTPRYSGSNKAWGEQASEWLNNWHKVMCLEGWPYDYETYCELMIVSSIVDGEQHTLLTEDGSGNARTQTIPAHRVGSRYQTGGACRVVYDGNRLFIDDILVDDSLPFTFATKQEWTAPVIDGVIVDGQSRPIAYRIYEDPAVSGTYRDISARSCFPSFFPMVAGQLHGISLLASSILDWQDWREFKSFEQLAQKAFSSRTLIETNETGEADQAKVLLRSPATFDNSGIKTALDTQKLDGGTIQYFKARSGSKLEAFDWKDRPGRNTQDWQEMTVRDAMRGTEWDAFFSLDPKQVGGAPMRVVVDRINRVVKKRRRLLSKNVYRTDVYALAKAIKNGDLPFDNDWYRWTYQGPPDVTADRRYEAQTDQMEYELGWITLADVEARRNGDWRQKREQSETETMDLYERAKRISDKYGISIQEAANRIELVGSNSFSMARRDTGDTALAEDTGQNAVDQTAKEETPAKGKTGAEQKAESGAPITVNIENQPPSARRKLIFNRDTRGVIIGAEIDDSE